MKELVILSDFSPLNYEEISKIKEIHQKNRDAIICLKKREDNNLFLPTLNSFIAKYPYLHLANNEKVDIDLAIHLELDMDNIYKYYRHDLLIKDIELMKYLTSKKMSAKRFKHTIGVAHVASKLAMAYHYDENKAYLAGLLHDIVKEVREGFYDEYLKYYDPTKLEAPNPIKHSYVAKYYLREHLNLYDGDILDAIYHHTDGLSNSLLAKILYIADKREPNRNIDDGILDLAFIDIHRAFKELKLDVERYIKRHE